MEHRQSTPGGEPPVLSTAAHRLSLVVNALLAAMKLAAGFLFGSPALIADGWHSLADTISSAIAWIGFRLGNEPADEDHHYGHGNLEALAGLVIGLVLAVGGGALVLDSLVAALSDTEAALPTQGGEALAMTVAVVSILANLGLARVTGRAAKRIGSLSLQALTWDNLGDALSSSVVLAAIGLRAAGYPHLELFVAGAIGVLIAAMGLGSVRAGFDVLMDRVSDPTLRQSIADTARAVPDVRGVQSVRIHPLGSDVRVDLEISVDGHLTVTDGHEIAHRVEDAIRAERPVVTDVHVHVNPCLVDGLSGANIFK
ncbi:MAG: cation diffusion facilitator family transporter [Planctomycetota bacterium]|nr:cation diffusion facilitator family transporter [Planctomycetota bacterium]